MNFTEIVSEAKSTAHVRIMPTYYNILVIKKTLILLTYDI